MDFLLQKLIRDVETHYDLWYYTPNHRGTKEKKKLHIDVMVKHYKPEYFKGKIGQDLNIMRKWFLVEAQNITNRLYGDI